MEKQIDVNDYIITKEDMKNIFNNRLIITKKEYLDYLNFKLIESENVG